MKKFIPLVLGLTLIFMFSRVAIAQEVIPVKVSNNQELIEAYLDPSVKAIEFTGGYYEYLNLDATHGTILVKQMGENGSRATCDYIITPDQVCWDPLITNGSTAIAGTNGAATCPPDNSGDWTVEEVDPVGAVLTWTNPAPYNNYSEPFTVDTPGKYSLRYTWNPTTYVQADWYFFTQPEVTVTVDNGCVDDSPQTTVYIDYEWGSYPYFGHIIIWKLNSVEVKRDTILGTAANDTYDVTGEMCGDHNFAVEVWQFEENEEEYGPCPVATDDADFYLADTPIVNAGPDDDVCGLQYTLMPSSLAQCWETGYPTTTWSQVTGPGSAIFTGNVVDVDLCGKYVFEIKVENGYCWATAQVTINFWDMPIVTANAAGDDEICGLVYDLDPDWTADCEDPSANTWWTYSGPGMANFVVNEVTVTVCGQYEFTYHVQNGACEDSNSVFIDFWDTPVVSAGQDDEVCGLVYMLMPTSHADCWKTGYPTTAWDMISGPGTASFNGDEVTVDTCGHYVFEVTVTNGPCFATAQVTIDFYDTPTVDAGDDDTWCIDNLPYTLAPSYEVGCPSPGFETGWTKTSGPGTAIFSGDDVEVDECGLYNFGYWVWNPPCDTAWDYVDIYFYDVPVLMTDISYPIPEDVCGYVSEEFFLCYSVACDSGNTPVEEWSLVSGPGVATFYPGIGTCMWYIEVTDCGDYEVNYKVTNGDCVKDTTFNIFFHEQPNVTIAGDTAVFACEEVEYVAEDNRTCSIEDLSYLWTVSGDGMIVGAADDDTVTIQWDNSLVQGWVKVEVWITALGQYVCDDEDSVAVTKESPTLAGQVKYWNEFETYMPTPFPTSINGTYPPDYFYISLYEGTYAIEENVLVDINFFPDGSGYLMSYWEFTLPVVNYGCDAEFAVKIWDGGLLYQGMPGNGFNEYLGAAYTYNNFGGVNATDALAVQMMATGIDINGAPYNYTWVGPDTLTPPYGYYSDGIADVNVSGTITALDALQTNFRAVGLIPNYYKDGPDMYSKNFEVTGRMVSKLPDTTWSDYFDTPANPDDVPFAHSDEDYLYYDMAIDHKYTSNFIPWEPANNYMNIYYECLGDINASHVPTSNGFKEAPNMELFYEDQVLAREGDELKIPISIDNEATLGALTLNMTYMNDLIEVIGVNYEENFFNINHEEGTVRVGWFSEKEVTMAANQTIAILKVRVLADIQSGTRLFELDALTELADPTANPIEGVNLKTIGLTSDMDALIGNDLSAMNYPNPFSHNTTISYMLPETGDVQITIYNKLGQVMETIVDQAQDAGLQTVEFNDSDIQEGVYFYRITLQGVSKLYTVTNNMIVIR